MRVYNDTDYEVRSDVAIPPNGTKDYNSKYPFRQMKVGDSFFVPLGKGDDKEKARSRIAAAASWAGKRSNTKFKVLAYKEGRKCGHRVWRIQ